MSGKKELERDAYKAVMRAFLATEDSFSVTADDILMELRDYFKITNEEHKIAKQEAMAEKEAPRGTGKKAKGVAPLPPSGPGAKSRNSQKQGANNVVHSVAPSKRGYDKSQSERQTLERRNSAKAKPGPKPVQPKKGKAGLDMYVGKIIETSGVMYDKNDHTWYEAVVAAFDDEKGLHTLVYQYNQVTEQNVCLEEYDYINLYDLEEKFWRDTGRLIDFNNVEVNAQVVKKTKAYANVASTSPLMPTHENGLKVDSIYFPDTALQVERAHDRQALQDIREKIQAREETIRLAIEELRTMNGPSIAQPVEIEVPVANGVEPEVDKEERPEPKLEVEAELQPVAEEEAQLKEATETEDAKITETEPMDVEN